MVFENSFLLMETRLMNSEKCAAIFIICIGCVESIQSGSLNTITLMNVVSYVLYQYLQIVHMEKNSL
jgi:hypothetical protein